ncbi:MAG TPA: aspartyl protease family protein [Thermoanaerobaculia bacterium]|nr:aspartyl protease family protein [Thermoanaerobaculia bacterium]
MRHVAALSVFSLWCAGAVSALPAPGSTAPPGTVAAPVTAAAPGTAAASGTAGGPGPATAAALLARAKEVSGGKAWDAIASRRVRAKIHAGGLDGTAESIEDVHTGRHALHYSLGPISGAQGFDGKVAWTQDTSGQARAEQSEDARQAAANEAYRTALGFWYPQRWQADVESLGRREEGGRGFDVLRITPHGGRPFELWIDAASGLFDRVVEAGAIETRTSFLADFREVDGVKVPFVTRSTNGDARYDQLVTAESIGFNQPIAAAAFALPAPPPADFTLAGGAASSSVPFELVNNHIYVDVKLDGKGPFRLLCDTGGANVVTPELAGALGLKPQGALQGRGVGDKSEDVGLVKVGSVELGGATLRDQVFAVFNLGLLTGAEGVPVNGLIGYEVFKRFVVRVDYEHRTLTLTLPAVFAYHGGGVVVPFKFNGHVPQVEGAIDGVSGTFDIDTGSRASVDLLGPFVEQHGLRERYAPKLQGVAGWGVGGPARAQFTRAGSLRLGGLEVSRPVVELTMQTTGAFSDKYVAGNVGGALLSHFNVTFDYSRQQLIFERQPASGQPIPFDRAGAWFNLAEGTPPAFEVIDVYGGSPAADAGLRQGDRIVEVDGKTPAELPLPALRERLRSDPPGNRIRFTVDRAGQRSEIVVVLKDLV